MGAWGYGPFDNDTAGDMVATLARDVKIVVERKSDEAARHRYEAARAAGQLLLLAHGTDILGGTKLDVLLRALARMRSDVEWLDGAKDPEKLATVIEGEIEAVVAKMQSCPRCNLTKELYEIVEDALSKPVPTTRWRKRKPRDRRKRKK